MEGWGGHGQGGGKESGREEGGKKRGAQGEGMGSDIYSGSGWTPCAIGVKHVLVGIH